MSEKVKISLMLGSSRSAPPEESPVSPSYGSSANGTKNRRGTRYEVQERLGEGALWVVYRVRPAVKGAPSASVALKALRGAANRHPRLPESLESQATFWGDLSHPHLATPIEWGVESGTSFFTTALLSGGSLQSRLSRAPLGGDEAMQLLRSMASLLNYLHGQNRIHGDIRPRQILFDTSGFPVLTDGGHASALAQAGLALADLQPDTALYLAPERASGLPMSPATDIYSLGATFYTALAGRPPFEGASPLAVAARHRHEAPVAPSHLNSLVPRELDALTLRLLDKDPATRPTAAELERLLQPRSRSSASVAPVAPPPVQNSDPEATILVSSADAPPVTAGTSPKRRPLDDLVKETLEAQDEEGRRTLIKKAKRRHGWREFRGMIGAIVFLAMLMGGGVGGAIWAYNTVLAQIPKQVIVPKYLGLPQEQAKQALAKSGLYMKVTRESYDPKVAAGTIMGGDPEAGREVRSRREVFVTVSAGQAPIKMVDFSALTLDQARTIILQHGMRLGSISEQYDDKSPRGAIIGQYPEAGDSFSRSQPITLVVSRGAQPKELDAQNGEFVQPDPLDETPNDSGSSFDTGETFAPLEPASGGQASTPSTTPGIDMETKSAIVRVSIPKGNGTQLVRIIVRDANGEHIVYQKAHAAGDQFKQKVTVSRVSNQLALVRVFVGETMITEEQI